jgi:hypothetical protein
MIGTNGATVLFVVNVLFAAVLGVCVGGLACLVVHQPWRLKVAVVDATLAAVAAVVAANVVSAIEVARGVWESRVAMILAIAVGCVIAKHVFGLLLRSSSLR